MIDKSSENLNDTFSWVSDWDDEYIYHSRRWTLAPSRLEVSFAYLF